MSLILYNKLNTQIFFLEIKNLLKYTFGIHRNNIKKMCIQLAYPYELETFCCTYLSIKSIRHSKCTCNPAIRINNMRRNTTNNT